MAKSDGLKCESTYIYDDLIEIHRNIEILEQAPLAVRGLKRGLRPVHCILQTIATELEFIAR